MAWWNVCVHFHEHDKVGRVAGGGQNTSPFSGFVNGTVILAFIHFDCIIVCGGGVSFDHRHHWNDRYNVKQYSWQWFIQSFCVPIPTGTFQEQALGDREIELICIAINVVGELSSAKRGKIIIQTVGGCANPKVENFGWEGRLFLVYYVKLKCVATQCRQTKVLSPCKWRLVKPIELQTWYLRRRL